MNLADMVQRKDFCLELDIDQVAAEVQEIQGKKMRSVKMRPKSSAVILDAHKIQSVHNFPRFLDWKIENSSTEHAISVRIDILDQTDTKRRHTLCRTRCEQGAIASQFELDWPVWADTQSKYNFQIANESKCDAHICTAYTFNPRSKILPLIRGKGVEIGPGGNPKVLPTNKIDVRYVETMPANEWNTLYNKQGLEIPKDLWERYVVADARALDQIEDHSIDFVFSNHVFEHLVNPLQVLENWSAKLRPGGLVLGVIPDCRFTFDCRQRPSCSDEWLSEYANQISETSIPQYEKWCAGTAPYNTPEDLIARNYSIHVHYYSPDNFSVLAGIAIEKNWYSSLFLNTSPNNKDFGFVLRK